VGDIPCRSGWQKEADGKQATIFGGNGMNVRINVTDVIDQAPLSRIQWAVLGLCFLSALVDGYDTQVLAYSLSSIAAEWGVKPAAFAPAFTSGLLGLTIGAIVFGQLGDKIGRKPTLIICSLFLALFTFSVAFARDTSDLLWMRFLVSLGVGGILPNFSSLVADYMPESRRKTAVTAVIGGCAGGAWLGGMVAGIIIPMFGWRSTFYAGGGSTLLIALACLAFLPESPKFLALRGGMNSEVARILKLISPGLQTLNAVFIANAHQEERASLFSLVREGRAAATTLFWCAMIINLMVLYLMVLWLPALARETGISIQQSLFASSLFSCGGLFGSVILGFVSKRVGQYATVSGCYCLMALVSVLLSRSGGNPTLFAVAAFSTGVVTFGGWSALTALIASYYPTEIRSTAIGYGTGVGRAGSMMSPWLVGIFLASGWQAHEILLLPTVPAVIAAVFVAAIGLLPPNKFATSEAARFSPAAMKREAIS
jgi:AAHS family 4-hydroxybenzoate transporter-like MFS transporter